MQRALLLCVCLLIFPDFAWSQPKSDPDVIARDLVGPDFRRARAAEADLVHLAVGKAALAVLKARSKTNTATARERCDRVLDALLEEVTKDITLNISEAGYGSVIATGGAMGAFMAPRLAVLASGSDDEVEELTPVEIQKKAALARALLLAGGSAMTHYLIKVPPLRSFEAQRTLYLIAKEITKRALDDIAAMTTAKALAKLRLFGHNVDLTEFVLSTGCRDKRKHVRLIVQKYRDEVLNAAIKNLVDKNFERRQVAEDTLFRLSSLANVRIVKLVKDSAKNGPAVLHASAKRMQHRIRYGISRALFEKLGHVFEDYERLRFRERREVCLEIERLGGIHGIRSLRAIMRQEKSKKIRLLAALSLARLGDPVGIYRIQQEGLAAKLAIPKGDLIAIYIDQGIKYLTIRRFANAEKEFLRVLKLDPKNESALYNIACCYSLWGKLDKALDHLKKAIKNGFDDLSHITSDADLDNLRQLPGYQSLIRALEQKKVSEGER
jgi:hypothetical protein